MGSQVPQLRIVSGGSSPSECSDAELIAAYLSGDAEAFGQLIRKYQHQVFNLVRRFARTQDDARDLTQRVFLQALEAAQRSFPRLASAADEENLFKAWVFRIALNLGANHSRQAGRWQTAAVEAIDFERAKTKGTDDAFERSEETALVRKAVLSLPARQREVFTLRIDGGLSFAEVASTLGIAEGNAKAHFHHAVVRLKDEVAKLSAPGGSI